MISKGGVRTAIIPVAGLGTRVLPATKSIPKEMMTIVDKPVIQYVVTEAVQAGITRIVLVTRTGKEAIENHFSQNYELEQTLKTKGKLKELTSLSKIIPAGTEILTVRQDEAKGLGHAILCAKSLCEDETFAVLLPDILLASPSDFSDLKLMTDKFCESTNGQILVEAVPEHTVSSVGIVETDSQNHITRMVEKPHPQETKSRMGIAGRYILPSETMNLLESTSPGAGGEIQLTDALQKLIGHSTLEAVPMKSKSFDCGSIQGFLEANVHFGLGRKEYASVLKKSLDSKYDS